MISFEELHSMPNGEGKGRLIQQLPRDVVRAFMVWEDEKKIGTVRKFWNYKGSFEYVYSREHHERFKEVIGYEGPVIK